MNRPYTTVTIILTIPLLFFMYQAINRSESRGTSSSDVLTTGRPPAEQSVASQSTSLPRYGVFEVSLTATGSYRNPYLQMPGDDTTRGFVVGTFTGPGDEKIVIDGFWDGGTTWKVRMAPTVEGIWNFRTYSSDPGLNGKTGTFICVPSTNKGFIKVDRNHPHHFVWSDGTPFYWAPVTTQIDHFAYGLASVDKFGAQGGTRRIDNGTFQALADIRVSQGFTATHWGYSGFSKPFFNSKEQQNEGGPPFTDYNTDVLNPTYYQFGDQRLRALVDRGIVVMFTLGWPDQGIASSIGHTRLKRYWRYLIARYAAYNVTWNLFGEADEFGTSWFPGFSWRSIVNDYGNLTRAADPYDHLITTHLTPEQPTGTLFNESWYDYIMLQRPPSDTSNYLRYGKPVINAEYGGYEDAGKGFGPLQSLNGEQLRPLIWDIRMRGGYYVYESWGNDPLSSGAKYSSLNNLFFQTSTRFSLLEYHPELFGGRPGLANPGQEYVVYLPAGEDVSVNLDDLSQSLTVEWFNPRTGLHMPQTPISPNGSGTFTAPDKNDWVLHLGG